jgi:GNAT superfamily N-acetyltransferase
VTAAIAPEPVITIRPWRPDVARERSFVWETSAKVRRPHGMPWLDWVELHGRDVDGYLARSTVVMVDAGADLLLGFAAVEAGAVWMVYVKPAARGGRLGLRLLEAAGACTGETVSLLRAMAPTPCWWRWTERHGIETERAR